MDPIMKLMFEMNRAGLSIDYCSTHHDPAIGMLVRVVDDVDDGRARMCKTFAISRRLITLYPEEAFAQVYTYLHGFYKEIRPDGQDNQELSHATNPHPGSTSP